MNFYFQKQMLMTVNYMVDHWNERTHNLKKVEIRHTKVARLGDCAKNTTTCVRQDFSQKHLKKVEISWSVSTEGKKLEDYKSVEPARQGMTVGKNTKVSVRTPTVEVLQLGDHAKNMTTRVRQDFSQKHLKKEKISQSVSADTMGKGFLSGGKLQPKPKQNMLNTVYHSDLMWRIIDHFIYSDMCTKVLGLGYKISSFYRSSHSKEIIIVYALSNDDE